MRVFRAVYSAQALKHQPHALMLLSCRAGIVSYSSRIIAAMRAIEDEETDKLFDDPLARVLAGDMAIKRVYHLLKVAPPVSNPDSVTLLSHYANPDPQPKHTHNPKFTVFTTFHLPVM